MAIQLIRRADWGAPPTTAAAPIASTRGVKVHYLGTAYASREHSLCAAYVRQIRASHLANTTEGYVDIAYNALVCEHGAVFEGRGLHRRTGANGNQALNLAHYAVCALLGNSGLIAPPDAMLNGLVDAIEWLRTEGDAGSEVLGHRDGHPTSCLPLDTTEVLTRSGWLPLGQVTPNHNVASWSMDSGSLSFDPPAGIVAPYEADTVLISEFETTPDHNWVTYGQRAWAVGCSCGFEGAPASIRSHVREGRRKGSQHDTIREERWKLVRADEMGQDFVFPRAVHSGGPGLDLTDDQIRLMVWLQGDGHFMIESRTKAPTLIGVEWHLRKSRKIDRLGRLLNSMGLAYRRNERSDGTVSLRIYGDEARERIVSLLPDKLFHWGLLDLSPAQSEVFLEELMHVDGCLAGSYYSSSEQVNLDVVQAIASINGRSAVLDNQVVRLRAGRKMSQWRGTAVGAEPGRRTLVGCLTSVNGTLLIRQKGRVAVVGNCPGDPLYAWAKAGAKRPEAAPAGPSPQTGGAVPVRPSVSLSRLITAARTDPARSGTPVSYAGTRTVEDALVREGLLARSLADGHYGSATVTAYGLWQRRLGYTGAAADGIPGRASLTKLGFARGFDVKD